jgi:hypothetical protein
MIPSPLRSVPVAASRLVDVQQISSINTTYEARQVSKNKIKLEDRGEQSR